MRKIKKENLKKWGFIIDDMITTLMKEDNCYVQEAKNLIQSYLRLDKHSLINALKIVNSVHTYNKYLYYDNKKEKMVFRVTATNRIRNAEKLLKEHARKYYGKTEVAYYEK